jgi:hypothetical protein
MSEENQYGPIAWAVQTYLDRENWRYTAKPHAEKAFVSFHSEISVPNIKVSSYFEADDESNRFCVFVYCTINVPEAKRLMVAEYLTRVNYRLYLGKIEMDLDDGQIRATTAISLKDCQISQAMIEDMENAAHFALNDAFPGIMGISYGNQTAEEAFAHYSRRDDEPSDEATS